MVNRLIEVKDQEDDIKPEDKKRRKKTMDMTTMIL